MPQFLLNIISIILIDIKNNKLPDAVSCDLAAELASDAPASAGHQYYLVGDISSDLLCRDLDRLTSQEILDLHVAQLGNCDVSVYKLVHARKNLQIAVGDLLADLQDFSLLRLACAGDCNDDLRNPVFLALSRIESLPPTTFTPWI